HNIARIMHANMLHERRGALPNTYIASVFSYLADDLAELQRLINQH
ncbi:TPA: derepression protein, partial [Escherichia coli]|nr:derepression protein [Escherichia coli]HCN6672960.1 derepression protein [Escherichia coli]